MNSDTQAGKRCWPRSLGGVLLWLQPLHAPPGTISSPGHVLHTVSQLSMAGALGPGWLLQHSQVGLECVGCSAGVHASGATTACHCTSPGTSLELLLDLFFVAFIESLIIDRLGGSSGERRSQPSPLVRWPGSFVQAGDHTFFATKVRPYDNKGDLLSACMK